jgi:hypothetical protein
MPAGKQSARPEAISGAPGPLRGCHPTPHDSFSHLLKRYMSRSTMCGGAARSAMRRKMRPRTSRRPDNEVDRGYLRHCFDRADDLSMAGMFRRTQGEHSPICSQSSEKGRVSSVRSGRTDAALSQQVLGGRYSRPWTRALWFNRKPAMPSHWQALGSARHSLKV